MFFKTKNNFKKHIETEIETTLNIQNVKAIAKNNFNVKKKADAKVSYIYPVHKWLISAPRLSQNG